MVNILFKCQIRLASVFVYNNRFYLIFVSILDGQLCLWILLTVFILDVIFLCKPQTRISCLCYMMGDIM